MMLRPSASYKWVNCPAYPRIASNIPEEPPSDPAREGTCAAWLAEMVLTNQVQTCADLLGEPHPDNGWIVERDMVRHIQAYVNMLRSYKGDIDVERKVRLNDQIEGTPDAFAILADGVLRVDDLKYGFEVVDVTSPQLTIYAGAILRHIVSRCRDVPRIVLGIYQPRTYHSQGVHRTRTLLPEELMREVAVIEAAGRATTDLNVHATPGDHCRRCEGAATCSAIAHTNYEVYHRMHFAEQRHMSATEMSEELTFLDLAEAMLKGRRDALTAEADARIKGGENIPGWVRETGVGKRRWIYSRQMVHMTTGVDPTDDKMVTPAELERQGADPTIIKRLTKTPITKAKLKPVNAGYYAALFGEN